MSLERPGLNELPMCQAEEEEEEEEERDERQEAVKVLSRD